tara:strand:- start:9960 stop:10292 length:333 start_codon:yes stop_codon:yes gene_type:complete
MKPLIDRATSVVKNPKAWPEGDRMQRRSVSFGPYVLTITQRLVFPTTNLDALKSIRRARLEVVERIESEFKRNPCGPAKAAWEAVIRVGHAGMLVARLDARLECTDVPSD